MICNSLHRAHGAMQQHGAGVPTSMARAPVRIDPSRPDVSSTALRRSNVARLHMNSLPAPRPAPRCSRPRPNDGARSVLQCATGDLRYPTWREATGHGALRQVVYVLTEHTSSSDKLWLLR